MASRPDEPPESIIVGRFGGIKNTVSPERLTLEELEAAVNVDIDDAGQVRRRRGYTRVADGDYHSLYATDEGWLVVKDGYLGSLDHDYGFTSITYAGPDRLSYARVGRTVYFTSRSTSGKTDGFTALPWGVMGGDSNWVSPVVTPTDTLGEIGGKLLGAPPLATEIELYNGRIYLAAEKLVWATELYLYDYVDKTRGFYQFPHDVTMLEAVDGGIFVGTEGGLYFLKGSHAEGLKQQQINASAVIPGSSAVAPASRAHPSGKQGGAPEGDAVLFMTADGICAGFDGGEVHNLTRGRVVFPSTTSAAALYREQDGVNQFVAVTDNGGTPASNTRIGDYVDAEIRRFQGG
jgi:hypothetical protein